VGFNLQGEESREISALMSFLAANDWFGNLRDSLFEASAANELNCVSDI
jgi:hypothetical protein